MSDFQLDREETMNMLEINIEDFTNEIKEQLEDKNYKPLLGLGKSGVGKTQSIKELAKELNIGYCELRLVTMTETDMLGIPYIIDYAKEIGASQIEIKKGEATFDNKESLSLKEITDKRTSYASNDLLPSVSRDGDAGLLVLDEITSATSTIRAAAYQLLDSQRSLGNYKLPEKWKVIALGNGIGDGGVFQGLESAFISRCMAFRIRPDYEVWRRWAVNNSINPTVLAFLDRHSAEYFHKMYEDDVACIFPCPRTWEELSIVLNAREQKLLDRGDNQGILDYSQVLIKASGAVGQDAGQRFAQFYELKNKITISPRDIVDGSAVSVQNTANGREFNLKRELDKSSSEFNVMYIVGNTVASMLEEKLKDFNMFKFKDYSKDDKLKYLIPVANVFSWIIAVDKYNKELTNSLITIIFKNSKNAKRVILLGEFTQMLPEAKEFIMRLKLSQSA